MSYDDVEIEDMEWNEELQSYTYPCPCGDLFQITKDDLRLGEEIARCPSCSLYITVIYNLEVFAANKNNSNFQPPKSQPISMGLCGSILIVLLLRENKDFGNSKMTLMHYLCKDEEDAKAIGRLFAEMVAAYVQLIATGSDESIMIVQALLEVASHSEFDIASMTFNFWHNLQVYLIERDLYLSLGNEASIEAERNRRLLIFRASYESLVSLVSSRVQYPDDYMELSREDLKDFKQTRYAVADVLVDAALVLGGDTVLKILFMKLVQHLYNC